jgi:hypothetical protein
MPYSIDTKSNVCAALGFRILRAIRIACTFGNSSATGTILAFFVAKTRKVAIAVLVHLC